MLAIEELFASDFFDLMPSDIQMVFEDSGLTQADGRDRIGGFLAAADVRHGAWHEDMLRRAVELDVWSMELWDALQQLDQILSDVRGVDLREAELEDTDLDGVRWSTATRWPTGWHERIVAISVPLGSGEFEIGGTDGHDRASAGVPILPRG
ncbi:hypothetical protein [Nocardia panacis]|uniref:hypothetical protein n=1 Tax=Nocardia panacis TaxID=2340916 RepID=UPI0011C4A1A2|nr:hypothetical protein [Nocardia panacis]